MKKILFILASFLFAGEMEIDGNLKVTGNIDASGQPINNVGVPLSMTDAINGNVLQDALSDNGIYEYKVIVTKIDSDWLYSNNNGNGFQVAYKFIGGINWDQNFEGYLTQLSNDGWKIHQILPYQIINTGSFYWNQYIFRKSIEENE